MYEVPTICVVGVLCGATNISEIAHFAKLREKWFRMHLPLINGLPHRLTINRTLRILNTEHFGDLFDEVSPAIQL